MKVRNLKILHKEFKNFERHIIKIDNKTTRIVRTYYYDWGRMAGNTELDIRMTICTVCNKETNHKGFIINLHDNSTFEMNCQKCNHPLMF